MIARTSLKKMEKLNPESKQAESPTTNNKNKKKLEIALFHFTLSSNSYSSFGILRCIPYMKSRFAYKIIHFDGLEFNSLMQNGLSVPNIKTFKIR